MELVKFSADKVSYHIRHDMRELPPGKYPKNEAIDPALSKNNYSLIDRGKTYQEINQYRHQLEKEIYCHKRADLVHAVEIVVQCPDDCPPEQKQDFFLETYRHLCSTLPMGERCVFVAQVHMDEKHRDKNGTVISKDHLHLMYVPAVPDKKHAGYEYKMCADQLTRKAILRKMHKKLQDHLDSVGIQATVLHKKAGAGKTISLSTAELKELTEKTGIVLKHSITLDDLATLLTEHVTRQNQIQTLQSDLQEKTQELEQLKLYIEEMKKEHQVTESAWGSNSNWGTSGWGNIEKSQEIEK